MRDQVAWRSNHTVINSHLALYSPRDWSTAGKGRGMLAQPGSIRTASIGPWLHLGTKPVSLTLSSMFSHQGNICSHFWFIPNMTTKSMFVMTLVQEGSCSESYVLKSNLKKLAPRRRNKCTLLVEIEYLIWWGHSRYLLLQGSSPTRPSSGCLMLTMSVDQRQTTLPCIALPRLASPTVSAWSHRQQYRFRIRSDFITYRCETLDLTCHCWIKWKTYV